MVYILLSGLNLATLLCVLVRRSKFANKWGPKSTLSHMTPKTSKRRLRESQTHVPTHGPQIPRGPHIVTKSHTYVLILTEIRTHTYTHTHLHTHTHTHLHISDCKGSFKQFIDCTTAV